MAKSNPVVLEPKTQAFIDSLAAQGGEPIYKLTPADARNVLEKAQSGNVKKAPAEVEDRTLPVGPGQVSVRIFRPVGASDPLPAVMYFHGGGWILGSKNTHDRLLSELTSATNAAFVFVNYTPSPEAQYPVPIEQAYAATRYIAEHGGEMGLDPARLAVAGDSVGGNMTAVITLLAKQRGGPQIRYQVMFYPVTDANLDTGSYREFADGPWLTRAAMEWFWNAYATDKASRTQPTASPLRATIDELKGLPPALLITDENDVLRDEGEAYARRLLEAGVEVTAVRYLATMHDFAMLNAIADTPATRSAIELAASKLSTALSRPSRAGAS
jgi:acetyl esterase